MQDPYFITAERLEDVLESEYGIYHRANRTHVWTLTDLLQQSYHISTIDKVYNGLHNVDDIVILIRGVDVDSTSIQQPLLLIPDANTKAVRSMYIQGRETWLLWLQSKQNPDRCWAWEIEVQGKLTRIRPMNTHISNQGWMIYPNSDIITHINEWESTLFAEAWTSTWNQVGHNG